jgi:hypothetical protein
LRQLDSPREPWNLKLEEASLQLGLDSCSSQMFERLDGSHGNPCSSFGVNVSSIES